MPGLTHSTTTIANQILFDYSLPPAALLSYLRLQALGLSQGSRQVGPLDFAGELLPLLGLKKTQARQHLRLLRIAKLITWTTDPAGRIWFNLYGPLFAPPAADRAMPVADRTQHDASQAQLAADHSTLTAAGQAQLAADHSTLTAADRAMPVADQAQRAACPVDSGDDSSSVFAADDLDAAGAEVAVAAVIIPDLPAGRLSGNAVRINDDGSTLLTFESESYPLVESHQQQLLAAKPEWPAGAWEQPVSRQSPPPVDPWAGELEALLADPVFAQAMSWLVKAGVWTDRALQIARQISANEKRGQPYLPTRADILGWIAYCFAFQAENKINKPAQALAGALANNRRCPDALRPLQVCQGCSFAEGYCQCSNDSQYAYPSQYIDFAFEPGYAKEIQTFWAICKGCHAFLCTCLQVDGEEEVEEEEDAYDLDDEEEE